ncbi:MAG TPA: hypothetical protein VF678_00370 [bacterium]
MLRDWPRIRERHGDLTLHVTYGWRHFGACAARTPVDRGAMAFRTRVEALQRQPGVVTHGALSREAMQRMYWRARYWLLPLVTPDAELFCLNALKARQAGTLPVIHRCGALLDTVDTWLPYAGFVGSSAEAQAPPERAETPATPILDWDDIVRTHWLPLLKGRS